MKCDDMNAGQLRAKITIQRLTDVPDGGGGSARGWATIASPKAKWKAVSGGERWMAQRQSPENKVRATIRFKGNAAGAPYYGAADRVVYRGKTYAIESAIDVDDRQDWIELMLSETKAS